jgi:acyl carrier protein
MAPHEGKLPRRSPDRRAADHRSFWSVHMGSSELQLRAYLGENCLHMPANEVPLDQPLLSSGLVDSFHLVDLALFVETELGVRLDDTELNAGVFDTLAQLIALVEARRA